MRSILTLIISALIVLGFLTFMMTYTVRFNEAAVVTTFDRASENSVQTDEGLKFRWPYPIQRVTVYDTRARLLQTRSETQQTADNRQIIVESFLTWRVSDPLKFFQRFGGAGSEERDHYRRADETLTSLMRSAMAEVSAYRLDQLFTATGQSRLAELEQRIMDRIGQADQAGFSVADYGVEPLAVGVSSVVLPEETTRQVFERMKATRERLAAEATSRGDALASTIRTEAESAAARISAFAELRAEQIRTLGDREAQEFYATLNEAPELAVFLEKIDFLRNFYAKRTTLVLPTTQPGMNLFDPSAMESAGGRIPPFGGEQTQRAPADETPITTAEGAGS
ncbi:MAG: SPFH domain-containing protein [Phycisphaerales bacterium]